MRSFTLSLNPSGKLTIWDVAVRINSILRGKTNNVGDVKLTAGATTTQINNPIITPLSHITLSPLSANSAAALATTYISNRTEGQATLTHANAGTTDRDFTYSVLQ